MKWIASSAAKKKKKKSKAKWVLLFNSTINFPVWFALFYKHMTVFCRKKKGTLQQTDPPSIPVDELFPSGDFPEGEIQEYKDE